MKVVKLVWLSADEFPGQMFRRQKVPHAELMYEEKILGMA